CSLKICCHYNLSWLSGRSLAVEQVENLSCVWPSSDTHDPKCQILALLPNPILVMPKERNTLSFSVFSEGPIQPMVKDITQVEVKKRQKTQKTVVFGSFGSFRSSGR